MVQGVQWIVPFFYTPALIFLPAKQWLLSLTALELEYFSLMFCLSAEHQSCTLILWEEEIIFQILF